MRPVFGPAPTPPFFNTIGYVYMYEAAATMERQFDPPSFFTCVAAECTFHLTSSNCHSVGGTTHSVMGLSSHVNPIPGVKPPIEYLEKWVLKDLEFGHWFWRDTKRNHGHDSKGQPFVVWRVRPTSKTLFESKGQYCVARLLIEATKGPIAPRARLRPTCGLPQCVNPQHWGP